MPFFFLSGSIVKAQRDWLYALPVTSCGMMLDDDAVRVAIGLRLGLELCVPHQCHCGAQVDAFGRHAFVCVVLTGKGPMDLHWFRGRAVDLLFGTSQLSVPWQTLMLSRLTEKLELAATKKEDKYSGLAADYLFQPIAVETLGPINESAS